MFIKLRNPSKEFLSYESLSRRSSLSTTDRTQWSNLQKGYQGELLFDQLFDPGADSHIILSDLLLECNNSFFQIDSLIMTESYIIPCEVKNYDGNYFYDGEQFHSPSNKEMTNPLHQLQRTESLLRIFLQKHGYTTPISGKLIFIHPEFYLYGAPRLDKIIFPSQLNQFVSQISNPKSKLIPKHHELAKLLLRSHHTDSPYSRIPAYSYDELTKGVLCKKCSSFLSIHNDFYSICDKCGECERTDDTITRAIHEFQLLFPDRLLTIANIYDWCNGFVSKHTIRRILKKQFASIGFGKWRYYQ